MILTTVNKLLGLDYDLTAKSVQCQLNLNLSRIKREHKRSTTKKLYRVKSTKAMENPSGSGRCRKGNNCHAGNTG